MGNLKTRMPLEVVKLLKKIAPEDAIYLELLPPVVRAQMSARGACESLLHEAILRNFLYQRPWETTQFIWHSPRVAFSMVGARAGQVPVKTDWRQVIFRLPQDLIDQIWIGSEDEQDMKSRVPAGGICAELGVPMAAFLWAAIRWFLEQLRDLEKAQLKTTIPNA